MLDIMTNPDNTVCPGDCFRPAGLAFDSAGRLWMSSDTTGEIFVLAKVEEQGSSSSSPGVFVMPSPGAAGAAGRMGSLGWGGYLLGFGLGLAGWMALF